MSSRWSVTKLSRSIRPLAALVALLVAGLTLGTPPPATAVDKRDYPIRVIDDGLDELFIVEFSTAGPYALLSDGESFFHALLDTGSVEPINFGVEYSRPRVMDPTYSYAVREAGRFTGENIVTRQHRITGEIQHFEPPLTAFQSVEAIDSTADGRYLLLLAGDFMGTYSSKKYLLYDAQTNTLLSSEQTGLDPDGNFVKAAQISLDGTTIIYRRILPSGVRQQVQWNRTTDTRQVADAPHPHNDYSISANLKWAIWPDSMLVDGVTQRQLKRKNLETGEVVVVDNESPYLNTANFVLEDGRVVYITNRDIDAQLFLWPGPGRTSIRLTVAPNGAPANDSINFFLSNVVVFSDGSRAYFTSSATNLVEGADTTRKRIYEVALTAIDRPEVAIEKPIPADVLEPAQRVSLGG